MQKPATGRRGLTTGVAIRGRKPLLAAGLILICYLSLTYAWDNFRNTNEYSRIFLTRAVVEHGTFVIDPLLRIHDTQDKSFFRGRHYSNKAPASSFLAIPAFLAVRLAAEAAAVDLPGALSLYLVTALTVSIPSVLFLLLLFRFWSAYTPEAPPRRAVLILYGTGTMAWPYSTMYYGHIPAAICLFGAFMVICQARGGPSAARPLLAAGLLCGLAFALEYPTALISAGLLLYAAAVLRPSVRGPRMLLFFLGAALPAGFTLYYHGRCFGGPLQFPYYHETYPAFALAHQQGIAGVALPGNRAELLLFLRRLGQLLISPYRGLFFYSPFLVLGIWGMIRMAFEEKWRMEGRLFLALTAAYLLFLAAFSDWEGGWSMGPRHLVPLLPFLATGVVYGLANSTKERRPAWGAALAVLGLVSITLTFVGTVTFPYFPKEFLNPLYELAGGLLVKGRMAPTLGELFGLRGWARILPTAIPVGLLAALFLRDTARFSVRGAERRMLLIALSVLAAATLLGTGGLIGRSLGRRISAEDRMLREAQRARVLYFMEREGEGGGGNQ